MADIFYLDPECPIRYYPDFITPQAQDILYENLRDEIPWRQETIQLFGKTHNQPRLTAWLGYGFSAYSRYRDEISAEPWTPELANIRDRVGELAKESFNSALINYYRDGGDAMGAHADDEPILGERPTIAALSLGIPRDLFFQKKSGGKACLKIQLAPGSLLIMEGATQERFKHGIRPSKRVSGGRISITFRRITSKPQ